MKLCRRCSQYFEDTVAMCPTDNSALEPVGANAQKTSNNPAGNTAPRSQSSIQHEFEAQSKETGKFNIKDFDGWGDMMKSVGAAAAKPAGAAPDKQRIDNKPGQTKKPDNTPLNQPAEKVVDTPIIKPSAPAAAKAVPPVAQPTQAPAPALAPAPIKEAPALYKSQREYAEPSVAPPGFEQPMLKKADKQELFGTEVERIPNTARMNRNSADDNAVPTKSKTANLRLSRGMTTERKRMPGIVTIFVFLVLLLLVAGVAFFLLRR
jgi:hypothetical protein